ncbi:MAG: 3-dehydroquinate synthase [Nitrospirae bacterium]|nr:MAG: 3-dehydroquinate synthase [Nitrospirota bacterium]
MTTLRPSVFNPIAAADRLTVSLGDRSYDILVQKGLLDRLGKELTPLGLGPSAVIITNPIVKRLYATRVIRGLKTEGFDVGLMVVPEGEAAKTMQWLNRILDFLVRTRRERQTSLIALGGGVVGDLAGFAASAYLRGIPFVQVPTTLVAQVDASIGGKTGVNHRLGKNLIGAFYQPRIVLIDPLALTTLPLREYRAGLAEVIKYGVIEDAGFFEFLERDMLRILARESDSLDYILRTSCAIKARVVSADEREGDRRRILNFGHTLGHALETVTRYRRYQHGEAVAIGMVAAADLASRLGLAGKTVVERIRNLVQGAGLPAELPAHSTTALIHAMRQDKKVKDRRIHFVLPTQIGKVTVVPIGEADLRAFLREEALAAHRRRPTRT